MSSLICYKNFKFQNYVILKCTKFALRTTTKDSTAAWQINLAGDGCDDVDECTSTATPHNCHTDAFCTNNDGSFLCNCNPTYIGRSIFSMMTTNLGQIYKIQGIFFEGWRTFCERRRYGLPR